MHNSTIGTHGCQTERLFRLEKSKRPSHFSLMEEQQLNARELLKAFNLPGGPTGYSILRSAVRRHLLHPKDGRYDPSEMREMLQKHIIRVGRKRVA
jgi:hypothetical protein